MKLKYLLITILCFIPQIVLAAPSASISTDSNTIENGKSVKITVTLKDTASWNIKISGSGAATCSQRFADVTADGKNVTKKLTLSCKATKEGTIKITVEGDISDHSGDTKDISLTKDVTVVKEKSSVNTLSELKVNGESIYGFSSSKTSYSIDNYTDTSITIEATATDANAKVSGTGKKTIKYGSNKLNITVTAPNGSKKTYTITVSKDDPRSSNNNLKELSTDKGEIKFDKDSTSYILNVDEDTEDITIFATPEDDKATVTGTGTKQLNSKKTDIRVTVKAENGTTKVYTISVIKGESTVNVEQQKSSDNSVKEITIEGVDFQFQNDKKEYDLEVDENTTKLDIKVVTNDPNAKVTINNNDNFKAGSNKVTITVTAENGDKNEYTLNVNKKGEAAATTTNKKKSSGINIWMIIAGIEFVLLILLFLLLLKKKKEESPIVEQPTIIPINNVAPTPVYPEAQPQPMPQPQPQPVPQNMGVIEPTPQVAIPQEPPVAPINRGVNEPIGMPGAAPIPPAQGIEPTVMPVANPNPQGEIETLTPDPQENIYNQPY